jgi:hypothetical protein
VQFLISAILKLHLNKKRFLHNRCDFFFAKCELSEERHILHDIILLKGANLEFLDAIFFV